MPTTRGRSQDRKRVAGSSATRSGGSVEKVGSKHHGREKICHGREAAETAREYQPDAVTLDVNMPVLDGLETARQLKKDPRLERTTFIAHTAANDPSETKASEVGFRHLVTKGGST